MAKGELWQKRGAVRTELLGEATVAREAMPVAKQVFADLKAEGIAS